MRLFTALTLICALFQGTSCCGQPFGEPQSKIGEMGFLAGDVTNFDKLKRLAKRTAEAEFIPRADPSPALAAMTYEQYREILFCPEKAVWWSEGLPFWLETFHRGFVQRDCVSLYTIEKGITRKVPFSASNFRYPVSLDEDAVRNSGHAGVKIAGRFPACSDGQEILTFLGSSYFRARSAETVYGASARGLAINVALNRDEEFPFFKAFWIQRPRATDESLTILAFMDSPSSSGAYQFQLTPGTTETKVKVKCSLYFRSVPEKIGLAPLTSMWIWGDGLTGPPLDLRPAVHDSDGLLIHTIEDGWIWRALSRQSYPSVSRFDVRRLVGFGLLQRNRAFYHFDDHNAQYHNRPSIWVRPIGGWQDGAIELLELPGAHEGIDSIAAYWVPNEKPTLDQPIELAYEVSFFAGDRAEESYVARATNFEVDRQDGLIALTIRFAGKAVADMSAPALSVAASAIRGQVVSSSAVPTKSGDWIARVLFRPTEDASVELSVTLMDADRKLSERFTYLCPTIEPVLEYPDVYTRREE